MKKLIWRNERNAIRKMVTLLAAFVMLLGLTACQASGAKEENVPTETGNENVEEVQTPADETESPQEDMADIEDAGADVSGTETTNEETDESVSTAMTDNFSADPEAVANYAASIKEAVAQKDMEQLADLTGFPVYVGLEGVDVVETREDFLALDPDAVFSADMCSSIEHADASGLNASRAGFTLMGEGEKPSITFGVVNGELKITGINY